MGTSTPSAARSVPTLAAAPVPPSKDPAVPAGQLVELSCTELQAKHTESALLPGSAALGAAHAQEDGWHDACHERPEDIPALAERFFTEARGRSPPSSWLDPHALEALLKWPWPGNIRELRHVMEAAAVECDGGRVLPSHLGVVAPERSAPRPVLVTTSELDEADAREWRLRSSVRQRLIALTLRVPGVGERGPASVVNCVLTGLAGRPIAPEALEALVRHPWRGQGIELDQMLRSLAEAADGPIDRATLLQLLPSLGKENSGAPIVALLFPTALPGGGLGGFRQVFPQGRLILGRASRLSQLTPEPGAPQRVVDRWSAIKRHLNSDDVGLLCLEQIPELGRAQAVIVLEGDEVVAHGLPGNALTTWAGALGQPLDCVTEERSVSLGAAGVIEVRADLNGAALVRVLFFAGEVALADHAEVVLGKTNPAATVRQAGPAPGLPRQLPAADVAARAWILDAQERAALNRLVCGFLRRGGAFAQALRSGIGELFESRLDTLSRYLDSGHPSQSCVRLYRHEANAVLRAELGAALAALPDPESAWSRLPKGIREVIAAPAAAS